MSSTTTTQTSMSRTSRKTHVWRLLPVVFGFVPVLLFGLVAGWFVHKLVDLGNVPWQTLVQGLVIIVITLVIAAILARAAFRLALPRMTSAVEASFQSLAGYVRQTPGTLASPLFWLDQVWPAVREARSLLLAWLGVYSTMAAVIALAALLCQTGVLAVAYLQVDRLDKQNALLTSQNELLEQQNLLSESARRAALLQIIGDVLTAIDEEIGGDEVALPSSSTTAATGDPNAPSRADQRKYLDASPRLLGRLAAACTSLRGYRYLGDDGKPISRPRSPERGFVLRSLVAAGIDITGLIDQGADFSFAEAENAVVANFRLEPTPRAASSIPGARGLILADSQLAGISFRASRLGEANFARSFLHNANFTGARLHSASFADANVGGVSFADADLRNAVFSGADLTTASFTSYETAGDTVLPLPHAFRRADLTDVDLAGAFVSSETWLDDVAEEALTRDDGTSTFVRSRWRIVPSNRLPRTYHQEDEVSLRDLASFRWRIANEDGTLRSSGEFGGSLITPRRDRYNSAPVPPGQ